MQPDFTAEEKRLLARYRHFSRADAWGWVLVFVPLFFFAAYGLLRHDVIAIFIAWAGTTVWLVWWLLRGMHNADVFRSILEKYESDAAAPSTVADGGH